MRMLRRNGGEHVDTLDSLIAALAWRVLYNSLNKVDINMALSVIQSPLHLRLS